MRFKRLAILLLLLPPALYAIEISVTNSARLDIVSRTSFGIDMDHPYRYGLANELTQVDLVFGLAPYQSLSNRVPSSNAVGFIDLTLFHLDLIKTRRVIGYNAPGNIGTHRYQTGEFLAGIAAGPWLIQLNAMGNEPFTAPWNKGLQFVNDGFKLSWAYLDSMVDVRRVKSITGMPVITRRGEENLAGDGQTQAHGTMLQFGFDTAWNIADRFGSDIKAHMVSAMYNSDAFGVNVKLGTESTFEDQSITPENRNGLAAGIDSVFTPSFLEGLKIYASIMATNAWGPDSDPNPFLGGTRVGYNIPLAEDLSVEPWFGLDLGAYYTEDGGMGKPGYEFSVGGTMRWPGQGGWLKDYILNSDGRVFPGMSLGYKIYEEPDKNTGLEHSLKFTLFEPKGNDGLFFLVGSEIVIDLIDLTNVTAGKASTDTDPRGGFKALATAYFDVEINDLGRMPGVLVPWTILYYDNLPEGAKSGRYNNIKIDLGLNLENAIANTTFGIVWNSGSLLRKNTTPGVPDSTLGIFRFVVEIRL